jgi:two-component system, cell cycle sensor histidine kinase and response regulator CckA
VEAVPNRRQLVIAAALALAYFATGEQGLAFARTEGHVSLIWPPAGIALAVMLLVGLGVWPGIWVGALAVSLFAGTGWTASLGIASGRTLAAVLATLFLQRVAGFDPRLGRVRDVVAFTLGGVLAASVSALSGATSLYVTGSASLEALPAITAHWWIGNATSMLLITPVLLTWMVCRGFSFRRALVLEALGLAAAQVAVLALMYCMPAPSTLALESTQFAAFVVVAWGALRFGSRGAVTSASVIYGMWGVFTTVWGRGPFAVSGPYEPACFLFVSCAATALPTLLFAAALAEHRRAAEHWRDSEERYRLLAENAHDLISREDGAGVFRYVSPACRVLLGYEPEELLGQYSQSYVHPDDATAARRFHETVCSQPGIRDVELQYRFRRKDGSYTWMETNSHAVRDPASGKIAEIVAVTRDITERRRVEETRRTLEAQVQHAQKLESLGILAGGVAHDFNNLLVGMLGNASLALEDLPAGTAARRTVERVVTAAQRAAELTKQMLAYSGKGRFEVEAVNLSELVSEMAHLLEASISKAVTLMYEFSNDVPPIQADATQLRQVVMNLIINASEAIGEHAGVVTIRTGTMRPDRSYLGCTCLGADLPEGEYVFVEVCDTGCGMDEPTRSKIFEPFFTTKFTGRGLGLAAVLGIVRGHRGAIHIRSTLGRGSEFRVLFPTAGQPSRAVTQKLERAPEDQASKVALAEV